MASCVAVTLAGCYQTEVAQKEYPTDYRQRHPIVLREGAQNSISCLAATVADSPRASAPMSFLLPRHGAGTPAAGSSSRFQRAAHRSAASDATREIRSIFAAVGVPSSAIYARSYSRRNLARQHQAELYQVDCRCRSLRRMAKGSRALHGTQDLPITSRTGILAVPCSATSRLWSTILPTWCSRAARSRHMHRAARSCSTNGARARTPPGSYTGYDTGKISDLGK